MEAVFQFLAANPYILLFLVVGMAVGMGRVTIKGYGLGMVASAIVAGAAIATIASTYGVKLQLDNFAKSLFYYLFMYGVGLRVGPSFINSLKGDGIRFAFLAVLCSVLGLVGAVGLAKAFDLPPGVTADQVSAMIALSYGVTYIWGTVGINAAVLMGGVAGARSHSGPAREASAEIGSSVPWIGFPVRYAVSGVLLTVFGYVAMVLS
jgi:putative transport protein